MGAKTTIDLSKVPTSALLKAARERNAALRQKHGPFASQKRFSKCNSCKFVGGVRELKRHKKDCKGKKK